MGEIEGVWAKSLKVIPDERGRLMEILRADDEGFRKFGQIYMTTNYPGVVKAWHLHEVQEDMVACVKGMIKLVLYDARESSPTRGAVKEYFIGDHAPTLVRVPAGVYHGWKGISEDESVVVNIPTEMYDYASPDEHRLPWDTPDIPYDWEIEFK
jgi:dTDP-4-dehydrorhamnose 3,5-epimerase